MRRREFITLAGMVTLLRTTLGRNAFAAAIRPDLDTWLRDLHARCRDLRRGTLSPLEWQDALAGLYRTISREDLIRYIDFEALVAGMRYPDDHAGIVAVPLPEIEGVPRVRRGWSAKIFGLAEGRAIVPHAHNDMVSAHFIIDGSFHVRTFDRDYAREQAGSLTLRPALDETMPAGALLTMSDERDNIHWLIARSQHAHTFDVPVTDLGGNRAYANEANRYSMIFVDPRGAPEADGTLTAPVIDVEEALRLFGHH